MSDPASLGKQYVPHDPEKEAAPVTEPLEAMVKGAWDLNTVLPHDQGGILGKVAATVNRLLARLQGIVLRVAAAAIKISKMSPRLAEVAESLEATAGEQDAQAREIAQAGREISHQVHEISGRTEEAAGYSAQVAQVAGLLDERMESIEEILGLIVTISKQTKLLSINATLEAARAGEHGAGFSVVAREIRDLANQAMAATGRVDEILSSIRQGVGDLVSAVGEEDVASGTGGLHSLMRQIAEAAKVQDDKMQAVSQGIEGMAASAHQQHEAASLLSRTAQDLRQGSDDLLVNLGSFRLDAHRRASEVVVELVQHPDLQAMEPMRVEALLRQAVVQHGIFELMYVTDSQGRQIVPNVAPDTFQAAYSSTGRGENWGDRPWFQGAMASGEVFISDIYRSVATQHFCFTIAAPIKNPHGAILGVLAADIHFANLLES